MQLLAAIGPIGIGKPPYVEGFPFDVADRVALPEHRRMSDMPRFSVPVRVGLTFFDLPCLLIGKVLEDLREVVAAGKNGEDRPVRIAAEAKQVIQDFDGAERPLIEPARLARHQPEGRPAVVRSCAQQIGVVSRMADAIVDNVSARIILAFGVDGDEGR